VCCHDYLDVLFATAWPLIRNIHTFVRCLCTDDDGVMPTAVDLQSMSSTSTSTASSSLPSDATYVTAAVTVTAAGSETQPTARCVFHCMSVITSIIQGDGRLFSLASVYS